MYKRQRGGALRAMNSSAVSSIVKTLQQLIGFFLDSVQVINASYIYLRRKCSSGRAVYSHIVIWSS